MQWNREFCPKQIFHWIWLPLIIITGLASCSRLHQHEPQATTASPKQDTVQPEKKGSYENFNSDELKANPLCNLMSLPAKVPAFTPDGWEIYDTIREFTAENLYQLINGGAELYLSYDMVRMIYINFVNKANNRLFIEVFIYDMGTPTNAFGIFSVERSQGESVELGRDSYTVDAHYFIWKGQYYIRIIASEPAKELKQIGRNMAHRISSLLADSGIPVWGLSKLPQEDLVPNSVQYFLVDAMGLDFMSNTYTAQYLKGNTEVMAFLSQQDSANTAQDTVTRYIEHTQKYGKGIEHLKLNGRRFVLCDMGDSFDIIFQKGKLVGGVFSVEDRNTGVQAAVDFWKQLHDE